MRRLASRCRSLRPSGLLAASSTVAFALVVAGCSGDQASTSSGPESVSLRTAVPGAYSVFGDSYAQQNPDYESGTYVDQVTRHFCWSSTVSAIGGTGFAAGGPTGRERYIDRLDQSLDGAPNLVVLQSSLSDGYPSATELQNLISQTVQAVRLKVPNAQILLIGPTNPTFKEPNVVGKIRSAVAMVASKTGSAFIDPAALNWLDPKTAYQPQSVQLTQDGQDQYAQGLTRQIELLGFKSDCAGR